MAAKYDRFPRDLCLLLYQLGVTATYRGFYQTAYAVLLAMEDMDRLLQITKCLYQDVARQYNTTFQSVERNIRTVAQIAWKRSRPRLEELAHGPFPHLPRPAN